MSDSDDSKLHDYARRGAVMALNRELLQGLTEPELLELSRRTVVELGEAYLASLSSASETQRASLKERIKKLADGLDLLGELIVRRREHPLEDQR